MAAETVKQSTDEDIKIGEWQFISKFTSYNEYSDDDSIEIIEREVLQRITPTSSENEETDKEDCQDEIPNAKFISDTNLIAVKEENSSDDLVDVQAFNLLNNFSRRILYTCLIIAFISIIAHQLRGSDQQYPKMSENRKFYKPHSYKDYYFEDNLKSITMEIIKRKLKEDEVSFNWMLKLNKKNLGLINYRGNEVYALNLSAWSPAVDRIFESQEEEVCPLTLYRMKDLMKLPILCKKNEKYFLYLGKAELMEVFDCVSDGYNQLLLRCSSDRNILRILINMFPFDAERLKAALSLEEPKEFGNFVRRNDMTREYYLKTRIFDQMEKMNGEPNERKSNEDLINDYKIINEDPLYSLQSKKRHHSLFDYSDLFDDRNEKRKFFQNNEFEQVEKNREIMTDEPIEVSKLEQIEKNPEIKPDNQDKMDEFEQMKKKKKIRTSNQYDLSEFIKFERTTAGRFILHLLSDKPFLFRKVIDTFILAAKSKGKCDLKSEKIPPNEGVKQKEIHGPDATTTFSGEQTDDLIVSSNKITSYDETDEDILTNSVPKELKNRTENLLENSRKRVNINDGKMATHSVDNVPDFRSDSENDIRPIKIDNSSQDGQYLNTIVKIENLASEIKLLIKEFKKDFKKFYRNQIFERKKENKLNIWQQRKFERAVMKHYMYLNSIDKEIDSKNFTSCNDTSFTSNHEFTYDATPQSNGGLLKDFPGDWILKLNKAREELRKIKSTENIKSKKKKKKKTKYHDWLKNTHEKMSDNYKKLTSGWKMKFKKFKEGVKRNYEKIFPSDWKFKWRF